MAFSFWIPCQTAPKMSLEIIQRHAGCVFTSGLQCIPIYKYDTAILCRSPPRYHLFHFLEDFFHFPRHGVRARNVDKHNMRNFTFRGSRSSQSAEEVFRRISECCSSVSEQNPQRTSRAGGQTRQGPTEQDRRSSKETATACRGWWSGSYP
jgi:hypothetical protein